MRKNLTLILILIIACGSLHCCSQVTEDKEEDTLPCSLNKTAKIRTTDYRNKAENAPFAYIYNPDTGKITQEALSSAIIVREKVQADHVFEVQIVTKYLIGDGKATCLFIASNSSYLSELKDIMNDVSNIRYLSGEINRVKGIYFGGGNLNDQDRKLLDAVKNYLAMDDVHYSFSKTRYKVIKLFRKVAKENKLNVPNIDNIETSLGRSEYESLTNRTLITNESLNSSSFTLPLPYLPAILSVNLSLVFLAFGGCNRKITITKK